MDKVTIDMVLWDIKEEDKKTLPVDFLIKRVIVYGGFLLIKEIISNYGKEKIIEVFNSLKISEVGIKRHYFFKNYLFK